MTTLPIATRRRNLITLVVLLAVVVGVPISIYMFRMYQITHHESPSDGQ